MIDESGAGASDPEAAQSDPRAGASEPGAAQSDPRAGASDPGAAQSDPGAGASEPGAAGSDRAEAGGAGQGRAGADPSEQELREAYEAELSRVTSAEMILQAAVSLLNIGGYRLGAPAGAGGSADAARDLEQVRDAIDGVRGLLPILERRMPRELRPLRDALSRLQMAYAREASAGAGQAAPAGAGADQPGAAGPAGAGGEAAGASKADEDQHKPGPAESSGRLWVPGR